MKNTLAIAFSLICCSVWSQSIYVDLRVEKVSPFLSQYSQEEIEQKVRDSITSNLKRGKERVKKDITVTFNSDIEHHYIVELVLTDTVDGEAPERFRNVRLATIYSRVYERGLKTDLIPAFKWFAVGYSDRYGNLHPKKTKDDVLGDYGKWTSIVFSTDCLSQIPYNKVYGLTQFNILQEDVDKYRSFKEVIVIKTGFNDSINTKSIDRLLNDALLREQDFYYQVRSKRENYINIYDSEEKTFTDHPLRLELVLTRADASYKMRLLYDKSLTTQSTNYNYYVPTEIEFSVEKLEYTPSQVLYLMHDMFKKLFRLNLN